MLALLLKVHASLSSFDSLTRLTAGFFFRVFIVSLMQVYSNIHCYTKTGTVVWTFYRLNNFYVATNGEDTIVKDTYLELKAIKVRFMSYKTSTGARRFYPGLPKEQATVKQLELAVA